METTPVRFRSSEIGVNLSKDTVGIGSDFVLALIPLSPDGVCQYNADITFQNNILRPGYLPQYNVATENTSSTIRIRNITHDAFKGLTIPFVTMVTEPEVIPIRVKSFFTQCHSDMVITEDAIARVNVIDNEVNLNLTASDTEIQSGSEIQFYATLTTNLPTYDLILTIAHQFARPLPIDEKLLRDNPTLNIRYINPGTTVLYFGVLHNDRTYNLTIPVLCSMVTMATNTVTRWSLSFRSSPLLAAKSFRKSGVHVPLRIVQPSIWSTLSTKSVAVGQDLAIEIEILVPKIQLAIKVDIQLPQCNGKHLFDAKNIHSISLSDRVSVISASGGRLLNRTSLTRSFRVYNSNPDDIPSSDDMIKIRSNLQTLVNILECEDAEIAFLLIVTYGFDDVVERSEEIHHVKLVQPQLAAKFSEVPIHSSYDGKDVILFNLNIAHTSTSDAPAYNLMGEFVCQDLNIISFVPLNPFTLSFNTTPVLLKLDELTVGESFTAILR